uniref:ASPSCR1 tether for SLC2A4, UBX domain containing n=1 Tax=Hippocampus comes TaxID=109280 RepID=A0A3Q2Y566_HIPCM
MAASGTSVTVLTPNGRRQTVKVSPNTPLLQVLEEVCKKHGFNPDNHGLKFQRTVLDLTQQWRFANLPNNAKLEVVPSIRTQTVSDSQVRIALQMEDGSRLQGAFSCEKSLWELLTHFPQIRCRMCVCACVCVCVRVCVCGEEALKKATLKSLGLTGGSAIVRFLLKRDRVPEDCMDTTEVVIVPVPPALIETVTVRTPVSSTRTLRVQQEKIRDTNQPKAPLEVRQMLEDCGEEAGPSGVNSHSSSSSSSSCTSGPVVPFIPFTGGGQRLGGPNGSAFGHVLSSSLSSSSLSASAVESPKAKKAKPSHHSATKVCGVV